MLLGNSNLPEFFGYLWVMDLRKGMGYWLSESMGYARKMPANQHGSPGNVWVTGEYGLSGVWLIGETTVHIFGPSQDRHALVRKGPRVPVPGSIRPSEAEAPIPGSTGWLHRI